jgi:hypothetical protein
MSTVSQSIEKSGGAFLTKTYAILQVVYYLLRILASMK